MLKIFYMNCAGITLSGVELEKIRSGVDDDLFQLALNCKNPKVTLTKLLGELMVRSLLARFWGLHRGDFTILRNEHGKPYLSGTTGIYYNISHSGDYVVCALSDEEVGVDIERKAVVRMAVANRFFHWQEILCLEKCNDEEQRALFFNYWSVKESYLKYIGSGLSHSLSSFFVDLSKDVILLYENSLPLPVHVTECNIDPGYACFVCSETDSMPQIEELTLEQLI